MRNEPRAGWFPPLPAASDRPLCATCDPSLHKRAVFLDWRRERALCAWCAVARLIEAQIERERARRLGHTRPSLIIGSSGIPGDGVEDVASTEAA